MNGVGGLVLFLSAALTNDITLMLAAGASLLLLIIVSVAAWRRSSRWKRESQKCRTTLDAVAGPIVVTDVELRMLDCNLAARRMLGIRKSARRSGSLLTMLSAPEGLTPEKVAERIEAEGKASFEGRIIASEKNAAYVRARLSAMDVGGHKRLVVLLEDISEEQQQAAQYEAFLEYLIKHVPVEVAILSPDGRYHYLSSSFIVDERQREWLIGKTDFDYCRASGLHVELALRRRSHRMEAIDRRETVFFEEELPLDGQPRRFAWRYCPFFDDGGNVTMVLGFGVDQTELVQLRQDIHEARQQVEKVSRLKEALLQNVSHEIRTPLSGIIGTAQMLQSDVSEEVRDFLVNIEENGHRLSETLNDMLDLAGLQAENLEMRPEILNLCAEMDEVARSMRHVVDRRSLFLKVSTSQPEILIRGDRGALFRCVKSVVDNAVKFTSEGGILLDVSQSYEYAYVRVMDTGVGIDENIKEDMFDAFSQEDAGLDRSFEGVGLGLTVTKKLLAMMDGDIRVHSRKGSGSSFVIRLPLIVPELRRRSGLKSRVLIADPQRETHRMVRHMLGEYFEFDSAHSLAEAAALTGKKEFEAVFVDIKLEPDLETFEVLRAFREGKSFETAKFILLDYHRLPGRRQEFLEEGWHEYIAKPLQKLELLNVLYSQTGHAVPVL